MKKTMLYICLAVIIAGAAFYGGMQYQKKQGPSGPGGNFAGQGPNSSNQPPAGMPNDQKGGMGGGTSGSIIAKDANSITVKMTDGSTKTVYYTDSTTVSTNQKGSTDDLATGKKVMVVGTANSDGSVAAKNINIES